MKQINNHKINEIINAYLEVIYSQRNQKFYDEIFLSLKKIISCDCEFRELIKADTSGLPIQMDTEELQKKLSKINELSDERKQRGVYYTPKDVTNYIIINCFMNYIYPDNAQMHSYESGNILLLDKPVELKALLLEKIVLDPTCGAGEFLINCFKAKIQMLIQLQGSIEEDDCLLILNTIHGNDICIESTDICKVRLLIEVSQYLSASRLSKAAEILNANFSNNDFVIAKSEEWAKCDIIIGNPPFVEYGKTEIKPLHKYGNIYADILHNSLVSLNLNGVYGLIVPISYIATSRMQKIRDFVEENTNKEFILSFADRPDCLFTGVHQKLCIVFGTKNRASHSIFTSNYRHWYKSERQQLLNGCSVIENQFRHDGFIPKIGNETDRNVFRKIFTNTDNNIYMLSKGNNGQSIYLNMRSTFYIKAFSFNPGSKEYKTFNFDETHRDYILCLLNSSLYFLFWTIISDCWHITSKELKHMFIPNFKIDSIMFSRLARQLESKLEETKKYIGTVQTEYEYKHKECFDIINAIDDELALIYDLNADEAEYVKNFAIKYRMGIDV